MKKPAFEIGSTLKHIPTGTIILLDRYATQITQGLYKSISGGTTKVIPNYNFLYGKVLSTNKSFKGLTREFELINL